MNGARDMREFARTVRARGLVTLAAALLAICLTCTATGADGLAASGCVWGPVTDAHAVGTLLDKWAAATNLSPFDQPPWDLSIDGGRVRVLLHFARGTLTLACTLDDACEPSVITIEASSDYEGTLPDEAAVKRLLASFRTVTVEQRVPRPGIVSELFTASGLALLVAVGVGLAGLLTVARWGWRAALGRAIAGIRVASAKLVLVLLGLALGFAIVEVAARALHLDDRIMAASLFYVMGDDFSAHRTSSDPFLHYELNPDSHTTLQDPAGRTSAVNIDGFGARLPTHAGTKTPGTFRILCFGGSTLFGANVDDDETMPAALERKLNQARGGTVGRRFEVWNFGTSAYNLAQATHLARTKLTSLEPDLILVQIHNSFPRPFFLHFGGDPAEVMRTMERTDRYLLDEQFPVPAWIVPTIHRLAIRHSAVYRAAMGAYRRFDRSQPAFSKRLAEDEARGLVREAATRQVVVVFVAIPTDHGRLGAESGVYPELPAGQLVDLNRPGREPEFYEVHPPAKILDEYAGLLVDELLARGLLSRP